MSIYRLTVSCERKTVLCNHRKWKDLFLLFFVFQQNPYIKYNASCTCLLTFLKVIISLLDGISLGIFLDIIFSILQWSAILQICTRPSKLCFQWNSWDLQYNHPTGVPLNWNGVCYDIPEFEVDKTFVGVLLHSSCPMYWLPFLQWQSWRFFCNWSS